jgi:hypothetical protein
MRQRPPRQALLFLCHRSEPEFISRFKSVEKAFRPYGDAYFIFDTSTTPLPAGIAALRHGHFSLQSLKQLGYSWMHDDLMPGHVHFPLLDFALRHPQYAHYWVVEYDVRLTAPWWLFFLRMQSVNTDFLGTHLNHHAEQPDWWWWKTWRSPDGTLDIQQCARFFGPLYRISRPAVEYVDAALKAGYTGHQELILPSLLQQGGYSIQDLSRKSQFGCPTRWSWYTRKDRDPGGGLGESSMRFQPPLAHPGRRLFTFYHPVKYPESSLTLLLNRIRRKLGLAAPLSTPVPDTPRQN